MNGTEMNVKKLQISEYTKSLEIILYLDTTQKRFFKYISHAAVKSLKSKYYDVCPCMCAHLRIHK